VLAAAFVLSLAVHFVIGVTAKMRSPAAGAPLPRVDAVQISVIEKAAEPPKPDEPKVVKLDRPKKKMPVRKAAVVPPLDPPPEGPPPPNEEAQSETKTQPVSVVGISLSSTSIAGSFKVGVGNTLYGKPADTATKPEDVKPYKTKQYALPEEPVFLANVSGSEMRRFYPEEALRTDTEGSVRVRLTIDDNGAVVKVVVLSDPGFGFGEAATRLARLYRFKPARVSGQAIATDIPFTIRFELE
jgi:protein TonB